MPVDTLGEDLVLLAIQPASGMIAARQRIPYGLRGSELVRLARTPPCRPRSMRRTMRPPTPGATAGTAVAEAGTTDTGSGWWVAPGE